jgi:hypothetical protein
MSWEEFFDAYQSARCAGDRQVTERIIKDARSLLSKAPTEDWKLLGAALHDQERKWLVAEVFSKAPVPKRLFNVMLRAAVHEINPSLNRYFVEPCIAAFGHRAVNEALLEYVEQGNDFEKAGAINALYWGGMHLQFDDYRRGLTLEHATPESRTAYLELKDVWERKRSLFLREFVSNENVDVRRSIIPSLNLDEADYPNDLKLLIAQAVEIARNHEDEYIRHRVEVQLGNERLLKPLPHRDSRHEQTD